MNAAFDPVLPDRVVCGGPWACPVEPVAGNVTELQRVSFCLSASYLIKSFLIDRELRAFASRLSLDHGAGCP
jgi:hypothetical protein